jgi:hypothetical protein
LELDQEKRARDTIARPFRLVILSAAAGPNVASLAKPLN